MSLHRFLGTFILLPLLFAVLTGCATTSVHNVNLSVEEKQPGDMGMDVSKEQADVQALQWRQLEDSRASHPSGLLDDSGIYLKTMMDIN
jgi:uncharacterized iron-regulated membrane protein